MNEIPEQKTMDTAPTDGTHIMGLDADGDRKEIWYGDTIKALNKKGWISGIDKSDPSWHIVHNFYPVLWWAL